MIIELISVAISSLKANKLRSALTMLGVIIGVSSVILLVSLTSNFKDYLVKQFTKLGTNLLIVHPGKTERMGHPFLTTVKKLTLSDAKAVKRRCSACEGVFPVVFGATKVKYQGKEEDMEIVGVDGDFTKVIDLKPEIGFFFSQEDVDAERYFCVIGEGVRKKFFINENPLGNFLKIGGSKFRVIGIMEKRGTILGGMTIDDWIYIPVTTAQKLFNTDSLFGLRAKARNSALVEEVELIDFPVRD